MMYLCVYVFHCLFLVHGSFGVEPSTVISNHVLVQDVKIAELKTLVEHQNTQIAEQKAQFEHQNTQISEQNTKICKLESEIEKLINSPAAVVTPTTPPPPPSIDASSGVVFTRWGREDCPAGISTSVYNGTAGGSSHLHTGGGVNYLCMPQDPIWDSNKDYNGPYWGYVYGSEYKSLPDSSLQNYVVPCSVCRATSFSTRIMIPGRNQCYEGWTKAYAGELTSGYYNHAAASEYACLDAQPQKKGHNTNLNGALFYPVRAVCGSLPCTPYINNKLLTCVVCLK